jgi:hypothetical protein
LFLKNREAVAYSAAGKPLTKNEYIEQINDDLKQVDIREVITTHFRWL